MNIKQLQTICRAVYRKTDDFTGHMKTDIKGLLYLYPRVREGMLKGCVYVLFTLVLKCCS
jgi:hypothetical protein